MNTIIETLGAIADLGSLKAALYKICSGFGRVIRLDVLLGRQNGGSQALCFIRMESPEEEDRLMSALGVERYAGDVVAIINMQPQPAGMFPGIVSSSYA